MSMPVREKMLTDDILKFSVNTAVLMLVKEMTTSAFPVINENGTLAGLIHSGPVFSPRRSTSFLLTTAGALRQLMV